MKIDHLVIFGLDTKMGAGGRATGGHLARSHLDVRHGPRQGLHSTGGFSACRAMPVGSPVPLCASAGRAKTSIKTTKDTDRKVVRMMSSSACRSSESLPSGII
jgi:hypothetical protein